MKRFLLSFICITLTLTLFGCEKTVEEIKLEEAKARLFYDNLEDLTSNVILTTKLANGVTATYESSDPAKFKIVEGTESATGVPIRSTLGEDYEVTLTATLKLDDLTTTKTFDVSIVGLTPSTNITLLAAKTYESGKIVDIKDVYPVFEVSSGYVLTDGTNYLNLYDKTTVLDFDKTYHLYGKIAYYNGAAQITGVYVVSSSDTKGTDVTPVVKTIAEINAFDSKDANNLAYYEVTGTISTDDYGTYLNADGKKIALSKYGNVDTMAEINKLAEDTEITVTGFLCAKSKYNWDFYVDKIVTE